MQTSKKIILTAALLFIALLVAGLWMLKHDLQPILEKENQKKYQTVSAGRFESLDFSANWNVRIKQGREFIVELQEGTSSKPKVENINGTLYFKTDTGNQDTLYAKITVPSMKNIKAVRGAKVHLENFDSDSVKVMLDGGAFSGKNNHFKHISFKTSGDASLEFSEDAGN